jgi:dihydrofolate reductase
MPSYNLIVAMCKNNGIGSNGKIPWYIKKDLQHFAKLTKGKGNNAVIMGNNTWKSLPGGEGTGLKDRDNFVLSSTASADLKRDETIKTFKTIADLDTYLSTPENNYETIWVIGGAQIYKQFLAADKINTCYVTYIDKEFDCDTFFPILDETQWQETDRNDSYEIDYGCVVSYSVYKKR